MTATIGLVLDCTDPTELARFWSEALGYITLGAAGNYVTLVDPDGLRPKLLLQAVPEAPRRRIARGWLGTCEAAATRRKRAWSSALLAGDLGHEAAVRASSVSICRMPRI